MNLYDKKINDTYMGVPEQGNFTSKCRMFRHRNAASKSEGILIRFEAALKQFYPFAEVAEYSLDEVLPGSPETAVGMDEPDVLQSDLLGYR